jgi:transcriptional regulator GlxA family with amidase domain
MGHLRHIFQDMSLDVCVVAFDDCAPLASIGPLEILAKAGELHAGREGGSTADPFFRVRLVSAGEGPVRSALGYSVSTHASIASVNKADLVIVPAFDGDVLRQLERNRAFVPWVRRMHDGGADVASICTGAFVLAEAGLLDGKSATTHWLAHELFTMRYPRVTLKADAIIVDHGRICTSGGATSFLTLTVYLVEKYCGGETSRLTSKIFLIDINKGPQTAYAIFSAQKGHGDRQILEVQEKVERAEAPLASIEGLAREAGMSTRNFIRRFKTATGNTPSEYIQRVRVEAAKHALEAGTDGVDQIATSAGYEDPGSFRKVFKRFTGVTPSEYRRRYRFTTA